MWSAVSSRDNITLRVVIPATVLNVRTAPLAIGTKSGVVASQRRVLRAHPGCNALRRIRSSSTRSRPCSKRSTRCLQLNKPNRASSAEGVSYTFRDARMVERRYAQTVITTLSKIGLSTARWDWIWIWPTLRDRAGPGGARPHPRSVVDDELEPGLPATHRKPSAVAMTPSAASPANRIRPRRSDLAERRARASITASCTHGSCRARAGGGCRVRSPGWGRGGGSAGR